VNVALPKGMMDEVDEWRCWRDAAADCLRYPVATRERKATQRKLRGL